MKTRAILFSIFLLSLTTAYAQLQLFTSDIQKGFRATEKSNYDKAIEIFQGVLKSDSGGVAANYGLAEVYFSKDYTGYNPVKAYPYILTAYTNFNKAGTKELNSLSKLDIDRTDLDVLKDNIDNELFSIAAAKNSADALSAFLAQYPESRNADDARELVAFYSTDTSKSAASLDEMIRSNPNDKKVKQMVHLRNMLAFQEAKAANTIEALSSFIQKYPDAEEAEEAKKALASLEFYEAKKLNTIAAYDTFLVRYPNAEEYNDVMTMRNQLAYIQVLEEQKKRDSEAIQEKDADIASKGIQLTIFLAGSIVLLLVAGLLYWSYSQKKKSNTAITLQKEIIEQKNKEIVDSINYAKRIQDSLLPQLSDIRKSLPDSFIFYRPRDIVSGDFYWFEQNETHTLIAAADCTGHGVPGSLVSMMGFNFLNQIVNEGHVSDPGEILNQLHIKISTTLNKENDANSRNLRDGMDIALLSIDHKTGEVGFSGAVRPLYYFDEEGLKTIRSGMYSIGGIKSLSEEPFVTHKIQPKGKATFYLFSDGYADQFGGPQGKKFKMKKLQELLESISPKTMDEQQREVERAFISWMGPLEQVDDVCMIGIRINGRR